MGVNPIIGILSAPCNDGDWCSTWNGYINGYTSSYIFTSYIKWIEQAGGRVLPILYNDNWDHIKQVLPQLNGILFTGGGGGYDPELPYFKMFDSIVDYLIEYGRNNPDSVIPVWATCLGFESLTSYISTDYQYTMSNCTATDITLNINYTNDINRSTFFNDGSFPKEYINMIYNYTYYYNTTFNDHNYCLLSKTYYNDPYLMGNFTNLGVSYDRNNSEFITIIESKIGAIIDNISLEWYGTQFHPEKPQYQFTSEWSPNLSHDIKSIISNAYFGQFFIQRCKQMNNNTLSSHEYNNNIIYNYAESFAGNQTVPYTSLYWFPQ